MNNLLLVNVVAHFFLHPQKNNGKKNESSLIILGVMYDIHTHTHTFYMFNILIRTYPCLIVFMDMDETNEWMSFDSNNNIIKMFRWHNEK